MATQKATQKLRLDEIARATEFERLQRLLGSDVLFARRMVPMAGKLVGIGEHFLFFEDVRILSQTNIEDYVTGQLAVDGRIVYRIASPMYNKLTIDEIHPYRPNPTTV